MDILAGGNVLLATISQEVAKFIYCRPLSFATVGM